MNKNTENMKQKVSEIITAISDRHPYKQSGNRESYSTYNEAWSDACDVLGQEILKLFDQPTASKGLEDLKLDLAKQNGFETVRDFETHADRFHLLNEYDKMYLQFALSQQQPTLDIEKVLPELKVIDDNDEDSVYFTAYGWNNCIAEIQKRLSSLPQASQQQNSEKEAIIIFKSETQKKG